MKTALITGASTGIGAEFAKIFVQEGHSVILVARSQNRLDQLAQELRALNNGIKVHTVALDLSQADSAIKLFTYTEKENMKVDFLVNNAGFGTAGAFYKLDHNKELEMIDLNVRTLVALTHLYLPSMVKQKSGHILNVASTAAFQPGPFMSTYYATKAFVLSFSEGLHEELLDTGVNCTALAPGPTKTEFAEVAKVEKNKAFKIMPMPSAAQVARAGYSAMMNKQAICIPGYLNRLLAFLIRFTPRFIARKVLAQMNQQ